MSRCGKTSCVFAWPIQMVHTHKENIQTRHRISIPSWCSTTFQRNKKYVVKSSVLRGDHTDVTKSRSVPTKHPENTVPEWIKKNKGVFQNKKCPSLIIGILMYPTWIYCKLRCIMSVKSPWLLLTATDGFRSLPPCSLESSLHTRVSCRDIWLYIGFLNGKRGHNSLPYSVTGQKYRKSSKFQGKIM